MDNLTAKQIKTRWTDIKRQISERQLLAYRVGIALEQWDTYMYSIPSDNEVNRIYFAIQEDRTAKTLRIKNGLSKIVGYRESVQFAHKSGVSDSYIRNIIEGKNTMAGYDIINRLELFLSRVLPDFELSIENPLTLKSYSQDYLGEIANEVNKVSENLRHYCFKLSEMARKQELDTDWQGNAISPSSTIEYSMKSLAELKAKVDTFWNVYIEKHAK
jgi:transcriptional regulator with XRE-family HTH domain